MGQNVGPQNNARQSETPSHYAAVEGTVGRKVLVQPEDQIFPHLAIGGGWTTTLVLINMTPNPISFVQPFFDPNGEPLPITAKTIPDGTVITTTVAAGTIGPRSQFNIVLADETGPLRTGWSGIVYDATSVRLGGYAIFRNRVPGRPDFEASVPLSAFNDSAFLFAFDNAEGYASSMALVNPVAEPTSVSLLFVDTKGVSIGTDTINLAGRQQTAFVLPQKYPYLDGKIGTVLALGVSNRLSALGFRFNPQGAFATVPILNWSAFK